MSKRYFSLLIPILLLAIAVSPRVSTFLGHTDAIEYVIFNSDGKTIASSSSFDGTIRVWYITKRKEPTILNCRNSRVICLTFSPDGKKLAAGRDDHTITIFDLSSGKEISALKGHTSEVAAVAYSPDGNILASATLHDQTIKLWDVSAGKEKLSLTANTKLITSVTFSPDGKLLATGGVGEGIDIRLWEVATGKELVSFGESPGSIQSLCFSPDGKTLASAGFQPIKLWDIPTGKERACENPTWLIRRDDGNFLAFSPDSKTFVAGHGSAIGLWDAKSGINTNVFDEDGPSSFYPFPDKLICNFTNGKYPSISSAMVNRDGALMVLGIEGQQLSMWKVTPLPLRK